MSLPSGLDLIIGPMYSSKTTELLRRLFICTAVGFKALYVNSILDNRNKMAVFSTHNPLYKNNPIDHNVTMLAVSQLSEIDDSQLIGIDIIGVDEGQFFGDLKSRVLYWVEVLKKQVIVAGLNGDSDRRSFGQIADLLCVCDTVHKLSSYCQPCAQQRILRHALFTCRLVEREHQQIEIGAGDLFIPVCRECYLNRQK